MDNKQNILIGVGSAIVFLYVMVGGPGVAWLTDKGEKRKEKDKEYTRSLMQLTGGRKTRKFK